jgi:hypothetical protein
VNGDGWQHTHPQLLFSSVNFLSLPTSLNGSNVTIDRCSIPLLLALSGAGGK